MKYLLISILILTLVTEAGLAQDKNSFVYPGRIWKDQSGEMINAHGGGILYFKGTYYWFGEVKKGRTWLVPNSNWEDYRVNAEEFPAIHPRIYCTGNLKVSPFLRKQKTVQVICIPAGSLKDQK